MASWMIHLRIADQLLNLVPHGSAEEFIMGNLAPDSGEPSEDEASYVPSKDVSHYRFRDENGKNRIRPSRFEEEYLTKKRTDAYTEHQYSFYCGYLVHLLTDVLWVEKVLKPSLLAHPEEANADRGKFVDRCKADWYDQDRLFLQKNPSFRSFHICRSIKNFTNTYLNFFSEKAFENRRKHIIEFYTEEHPDLDREYVYFTEEQANAFVETCSAEILNWLREHCNWLFYRSLSHNGRK